MKDTVELTKNTNQNGSSTARILLKKNISKVKAARRRIGIRRR